MNIFKRESKLARRITWRVILIVAIINLFVVGAVILSDLAMSMRDSKMRAKYLTEGINGKMETMIRVVEATALNNVAEVEDNLDSPEKVLNALEHELRLNHFFMGCFVAFEPNYYSSQGRWFEPYVAYRDSNHIERLQIGSANHDYFKMEWYDKGLSLEKGKHGYLSDPYYDPDGGKSLLCSYVLPVYDRQGRKVGVYGIDLSLDWLVNTIISEEEKVKGREIVEENPNHPDPKSTFFIQVLDSKGQKVTGSETLDEDILKSIQKEDSIELKKMEIMDTSYFVTSQRIGRSGWTLVVAQSWMMVLSTGIILATVILLLMTIGGIAIFLTTHFSIWRATKPLRFLSASAKEVAKGNFDTQLPSFKRNDEIGQLRDSFDTMQQSLKQYVEELKESTASKASLESELRVAHDIQMSMLPKTFPPFPERNDIELYAVLTPAKAVGGDLYDFFIHDEHLYFCIGDVSGKGVPASLVMAVTRTLFRNISAHTSLPSHIVETMNDVISEGNDANMFVTLFVGVLDLKTGLLRYCNAGHDAPYVEDTMLSCNPNLPVGAIPDMKFSEQEAVLAPGTTIFLYTDGLTEAEDATFEQFGKERVAGIVGTHHTCTPEELIRKMTEAVHQFVGDTEQSDDLTMLAIEYKPDNRSIENGFS